MTATTCMTYTTARHTRSLRARLPRPRPGPRRRALPAARRDHHQHRPAARLGLQLDDQRVASRHALLLNTPVGTVLLDDRDTGGTFVNGERVTPAKLAPGDEIRLGDVTFSYVEA